MKEYFGWRIGGCVRLDAVPADRWLAYADFDPKTLVTPRDPEGGAKSKRGRIARERGPGFVLWGRAMTCRRMGCPGRVAFWGAGRMGRARMCR